MKRLLYWWLARQMMPRQERVMHYEICSHCSAWRCDECRYLVLEWFDHADWCSKRRTALR